MMVRNAMWRRVDLVAENFDIAIRTGYSNAARSKHLASKRIVSSRWRAGDSNLPAIVWL